jgi:transposase InsO family protein
MKVGLVDGVRDEFGLAPALSALDLARSTWSYQAGRVSYAEKHADLRSSMLEIARKSPDYGYRRMTDELSEQVDRPVNSKVVRRLSQVLGLTQLRKPKAPRRSAIRRIIDEAGPHADLVPDLQEIGLYEVLFTDFTEIEYARGKAILMPLLDAHSKDVVGSALGPQRSTDLALLAWSRARRRLRRLGVPIDAMIIHHDRDSVYTSEAWVRKLVVGDGVRLSYALRGARDNPEMESWNGRFKTENADLFADARTFEALEVIVEQRMKYYTDRRRHSSIGNQAPRAYVRQLLAQEE